MRIRRMHMGEDILLARHGQRIQKMKLDRGTNTMVATLSDGSHDTAPNHISYARPQGQVLIGEQTVTEAQSPRMSAADLRFLLRFILIWLAISVVLAVCSMWIISATGNPLNIDPMSFSPMY